MATDVTTRFGSIVQIISRHPDYETTGWVDCLYPNGNVRSFQTHDLRSDGGAREIDELARKAPVKQHTATARR